MKEWLIALSGLEQPYLLMKVAYVFMIVSQNKPFSQSLLETIGENFPIMLISLSMIRRLQLSHIKFAQNLMLQTQRCVLAKKNTKFMKINQLTKATIKAERHFTS